jgi:hypothetical protein
MVVSIIAELLINLQYLKTKVTKIPNPIPIKTDKKQIEKKLPTIPPITTPLISKAPLLVVNLLTDSNKMIATASFNFIFFIKKKKTKNY